MHRSAYEAMGRCLAEFVPQDRRLRIVDFGSGMNQQRLAQGMTHRELLADYDAELIGIDVVDRLNVDIVMQPPYRVPLKSNSVDVVISGQVFEHIPFFWASAMEISRVLKPGGVFIITVPSRGHPHTQVDCWRYYADGIRAMATFSGLVVRKAETDFPIRREGEGRHYDLIDDVDVDGYWGDTVGVLEKPASYPTRRMALVRRPVVWWANRVSGSFVSTAEIEAERRARVRRRARKRARSRARAHR